MNNISAGGYIQVMDYGITGVQSKICASTEDESVIQAAPPPQSMNMPLAEHDNRMLINQCAYKSVHISQYKSSNHKF